jgi:hypothetical protein
MLDDEDGNIEHIDNRRYTMRDIGTIEKRLGQLEEITALTMMEMETSNIDVLDSTGVNRLKAGITADNFQNHFQSDTGLADYRAAIDPARNELRPSFIARPIELIYDSAVSSGVVRVGDKVMMAYSQVAWKTQDNASRGIPVNPYGSSRINGTITMSPSSDAWYETEIVSTRVQKGDASFDTSNATIFGNWDFNWSGISDDEAANYKTGDQIGSHAVDGGTTTSTSGSVTTEYRKRETQSYYVSDVSTVKEIIGSKILNRVNIPYMRSRFISFKATGLRPNTQYFPFFDAVDVSEFCNTSTGVGGFAHYGSLARNSPLLDASNIHSGATGFPGGLGGKTTKILTDANGSVSGTFLLPRTDAIKFKAGKKKFTLMDISIHNKSNATSMASFIFESAGILQETENTVLETENISVGSSSNVVTTEEVINIVLPVTGSPTIEVVHEGSPPDNNNNGVPDHSEVSYSTPTTSVGTGNAVGLGGEGSDGGDGGGDGTVICTALYDLGLLDKDIFELDRVYGSQVDIDVYNGYYLWAKPIADYIRTDALGARFMRKYMAWWPQSWALHMAHLIEPEKYKPNRIGQITMAIGNPLCKIIGKMLTFKVKEV